MLIIAVIDLRPIVRIGIVSLLKSDFPDSIIYRVREPEELNLLNMEHVPDIIILGNDQQSLMKNLSQLRTCYFLFPSIPVIIYGEMLGENETLECLDMGVKGFLLKKNHVEELITCVKRVLQGKFYLCQEVIDDVFWNLVLKAKQKHATHKFGLSSLTNRESSIAHYLCEGMRTTEIAKKLCLKASTVSTFRYKIYRKMKVTNIIDLSNLINVKTVSKTVPPLN